MTYEEAEKIYWENFPPDSFIEDVSKKMECLIVLKIKINCKKHGLFHAFFIEEGPLFQPKEMNRIYFDSIELPQRMFPINGYEVDPWEYISQ